MATEMRRVVMSDIKLHCVYTCEPAQRNGLSLKSYLRLRLLLHISSALTCLSAICRGVKGIQRFIKVFENLFFRIL